MSAPIPRIPRADWLTHPNWPEQVLLVGSHRNFVRISEDLVANCMRVEDTRGIEWLYRAWISAMRSHEAYEEHKLYPYLERRFGQSFGAAAAGHEELHACDAEICDAFEAIRTQDDPSTRARLHQALQDHHQALEAHLHLEEDLVIPLLLELERDEFRRYTRSPIEVLLAPGSRG